MASDLIYFIITAAITAATGIISYFLKRTMDRTDGIESENRAIREAQYMLSEKYATKAEVNEIKETMRKLESSLDYIKEHTTKNEDFIRVMTRLENKIDLLQRSE